MASFYVRSAAAGTGTGADWTNAFTTLAAAFSGKTAGDTFYVSEDHAETQASAITLTSPGTNASPCFVYCVNHAGSVPPVSADLRTTATITTTGNSQLNISGPAYYYGIAFNAGSGAVAAIIQVGFTGNGGIFFTSCALNKNGTSSVANAIQFGGTNILSVVLENTTLQFGAINDGLKVVCAFLWRNTPSAITGATIPVSLVPSATAQLYGIYCEGVDLSAITGTIINSQTTNVGRNLLHNCKLASAVTVAATPTQRGFIVDLVRCDNGATNYRTERYLYEGTQTVETTIVRTGGASDGTTVESWKLVSTANSKWVAPFYTFPISIWNDSTSAITTLTIYGTTTGGGVPNNDDIWVEVEYLGSALTPQGSFITTTKTDNLAASAATNNSSDASTWGGGGAGNGFKIVVPSFTPGMKGPINITVKVAKASSTYYIDPRPSISGVTISKSEILAPGVYANEISSGTGGGISRARGFGGFS